MLVKAVLLSLLAIAYGQEYECGRPKVGNPLDIPDNYLTGEGPNEAIVGLSPWTLSLEQEGEAGFEHVCGAALIDTVWALTSARCVTEFGEGAFRVIAGVVDRTQRDGEEQIISVDQVIVHPQFNGSSWSYPNDIAILSLAEPADIEGRRINPICLPPSSDIKYWENPSSLITGWGVLNVNDTAYPSIMHSAWIDILRPAFCDLWWPDVNPVDHDYHQCVFDSVNRQVSICRGDLGGPLQAMTDGIYDLAGVASFHADECDRLTSSVYTDLPMHLDWIVDITGVSPRPL